MLPKSETFILVSQIIRAAISIPANVAEGFGRNSHKEFLHLLSIAYASLLELDSHVVIAKEEYKNIDFSKLEALIFVEQKMLRAFMSKVKLRN